LILLEGVENQLDVAGDAEFFLNAEEIIANGVGARPTFSELAGEGF
jgi:hypothetical protein